MPLYIFAVIIGYLLGSFPSAYIMGRIRRGVDIRTVDSGNVGAASVIRQIGAWEGIGVGFLDMAKGAGPILIAGALDAPQPWVLGAGFTAILGHNYPVYIGFRGGRGVATTIGTFLVLAPVQVAIVIAIVAVPFFTTRKFAFAAAIGLALLPLLIWLFDKPMALVFYSLAILAFMAIRNFSMIKRVCREDLKLVIKRRQ